MRRPGQLGLADAGADGATAPPEAAGADGAADEPALLLGSGDVAGAVDGVSELAGEALGTVHCCSGFVFSPHAA
jgi:hypothetical protein